MYLSKQKIFFKRSPYSNILGVFFLILCIILHLLSTSYLNRGQLIIEWIDLQICTCIYVHQDLFISLIAEKRQSYYITYINSRLISVYYIIYIISFVLRWNAMYTKIYILLFIIIKIGRSEPILYLLYIYLYFKRKTSNIFNENKFSLKYKKKIRICLSQFGVL